MFSLLSVRPVTPPQEAEWLTRGQYVVRLMDHPSYLRRLSDLFIFNLLSVPPVTPP